MQVRQPAAPRAAAGDAPAAAAAASSHASGRHAFLHDFCMCIPYGALLLAGGLVAKLFGWGQPAVVMAVIGALQVPQAGSLCLKGWEEWVCCIGGCGRGGKPVLCLGSLSQQCRQH